MISKLVYQPEGCWFQFSLNFPTFFLSEPKKKKSWKSIYYQKSYKWQLFFNLQYKGFTIYSLVSTEQYTLEYKWHLLITTLSHTYLHKFWLVNGNPPFFFTFSTHISSICIKCACSKFNKEKYLSKILLCNTCKTNINSFYEEQHIIYVYVYIHIFLKKKILLLTESALCFLSL